MSNFYNEDLAYVHHVGFGDFARLAGEQLLALLQDHELETGLVVDLGCGSGIWARRLLQAGYQVSGMDLSAEMLTLARQYAPGGHFQQASVFEFELPPCQVITALGEVLGYGSDGLPDDQQLAKLFQRAAASLPPGGLLIFDVIVNSATESLDYGAWRKGTDWAVLVDSKEDRQLHCLTREITVFREVDGAYRRSDEQHYARVFNENKLQQLLKVAGFHVSVSEHYGDYRLAKRRKSFVAVRS